MDSRQARSIIASLVVKIRKTIACSHTEIDYAAKPDQVVLKTACPQIGYTMVSPNDFRPGTSGSLRRSKVLDLAIGRDHQRPISAPAESDLSTLSKARSSVAHHKIRTDPNLCSTIEIASQKRAFRAGGILAVNPIRSATDLRRRLSSQASR